ncbi:MAG: sulfate adenylyltransferase subunit CysD [Bacteroidetes bacterium]|jgi:sulfate adenylyltransferase subunit 2|nr:sulfate adenylyltransferase subunit CysD [Bacteroidota bacterium]MBT3800303.1 sulfate adenylyltransferase subunit CysD [Bacteroidota bacterium]MBT3935228.1 sulfate adenylyltransferase subunit CysD [Bacteroidota bacterium]MBT4727739.1 sulfate adenylyltransferase subunit CysD [Bacteroidota bacterium]MBT7827104.1 sulfate adenylyltransferase subunit CysD [Bacteroidota bacterium]
MAYKFSHLDHLESEAVYIIREVAAQFQKPMLLFSGGKDSMLILHLAWKAFYPARIPFPIVHVDTGHNFEETIVYRDKMAKKYEVNLVVGYVQDAIDSGKVKEETGINSSRNWFQSVTLLDTIESNKFDCALGGGRRDEEKARAKERFFSHRNEFGEWDPKNQRPELWNLFNGRKNYGEHFRVFPISNWTEMDVWQYIKREEIELPSIYFNHKRRVFNRDGVWLAESPFNPMKPTEVVEEKEVRFRTIGDISCTGAIESRVSNIDDIIAEVAAFRVTERSGRHDDKRSETAMEDRKKEGYF